jgi:hypothetical protein
MEAKQHRSSAEQVKLWLIAGLMVVSTVLFVVGVTLERSRGEDHETSVAHQEASETHSEEAGEAHSEEANETHAEEEMSEPHSEEAEETHSEIIFGLNLESPWLVATAALSLLVLAAALLRFGHPVLIVVIPVVILMALLDVVEVTIQMSEGNMDIAILAAIIGLTRTAVAILAIIALREWRTSLHQVDTNSRQSAT